MRKTDKDGRSAADGRAAFQMVLMAIMGLFIGLNLYSINARTIGRNPMPMPFGTGFGVVLSGSMEPALSVGDLIIVRPAGTYGVGDIVVYQTGDSLVVHRVVETGDGYIVTRGDANNTDDDPVSTESIKGRVVLAIPHLGDVLNFLRTGPGIVLVVGLLIFLIWRSKENERADDERDIEEIKAEIARLRARQENIQSVSAQETEAGPDSQETTAEIRRHKDGQKHSDTVG